MLTMAKRKLHAGCCYGILRCVKSNASADDKNFMARALTLARRGVGKTSPNPAVGAVIASDGQILAEGWHRGAGKPHAEIEALRKVRDADLRKATLYVTLEPCSTQGRTPPCTDAVIAAGFRRVVWGATDPNPAHAGRAAALFAKAGIRVTRGVLEKECTALNESWNHWIVTGMPFVTAKCGMSLDGRISTRSGTPPWITNEASRRDAMKLRASVDAILVGAGTVRADNPRLTIRLPGKHTQPWRVILTRSGKLPKDAFVFTDEHRERTLVFQGRSLRSVLKELGRRQVTSVMMEGGGTVLGEAFDRNLVNRVQFYIAPVILGGPTPAVGGRGIAHWKDVPPLADMAYRRFGSDVRITGNVQFLKKAG